MGEAKLRREREEGRQMRGTCQTCEHFSAMHKECREDSRRGTPMMGPNGPGVFSYWPTVEPTQWCGKHKPDAAALVDSGKGDAALHIFNGGGTA